MRAREGEVFFFYAPAHTVRATHYRSARDSYAKLKKRAKASLDERETASLAALESASKSIEAKLDDLYDTAPDVPVSREGCPSGRGALHVWRAAGAGRLLLSVCRVLRAV